MTQPDLFTMPALAARNPGKTCYNCDRCDVDNTPERSGDDMKLIFCCAYTQRFEYTRAEHCAYFLQAPELMSEKKVDDAGRVYTERFFLSPDGIREPLSDRIGQIPASLIAAATGRNFDE